MTAGRIVFVLLAIGVFVLDRVTKSLVAAEIPYGTEVSVIGHLVGITNVRNSGAAFGFAPALAWIFPTASVVVAIGLVVYVVRSPSDLWNDASLGLVRLGAQPAPGALDADFLRIEREIDPLAGEHVALIVELGIPLQHQGARPGVIVRRLAGGAAVALPHVPGERHVTEHDRGRRRPSRAK